MTSGAPWSVKGIDPKVREVAKDMARRAGMTLGEWLNQMILEDGGAASSDLASHGRSPGLAAFGNATLYGRHDAPRQADEDTYRMTEALDRLSARIEAAEHRSAAAIQGIDQSVSQLVARLDGAERDHAD